MDDVALDTEELLTKVEQQRQQLFQLQMAKTTTPALDGFLSISRVCELRRNVRPDEYTPHYVPIGPYHWSQRRIDEKSKWLNIFLDAFSSRTGENDKKVLLRKLLQEMKNLDASSCYSDRFDGMGVENEFLHMLLLDGCYLLACFADSLYRPNNNVTPEAPQEEEEPLTRTESATGAAEEQQMDGMAAPTARTEGARGVVPASVNDGKVRDILYLLENQIPFFVVQKIYGLVTGESPSSAVLTMFAARVKKELQDQLYISATAEGPPPSDPSHLLHLVRTYFTPPAAQAEGGDAASRVTGRWRRATEYCRYGNVRFHPRKLDSVAARSVLDVSLAGGKLLVPHLRVDNDTWTILRNLMALEEHHAVSLKKHVTAYCLFMSQLACTEEDVALLSRSGVVQHFLGSDAEAAAGFADLCKGVRLVFDDPNSNYLKPVWHKLERRYESGWHNLVAWSRQLRWHNLVAWFRQTHFRTPWYAAAFVAAIILFVCQVLQGIYVIIDHIKKK